MGVSTIGTVGVGLQPPQPLYPTISGIAGAAVATNRVALPPGGDFLIPPGTWGISPGLYSTFQLLDPVTQTWMPYPTLETNAPFLSINADGQNFRMINPLGFPAGAIITNAGTGFTSAPTVTASVGGSTWLALVGGGIGTLNINTASSGTGYAVPPLVSIAAPPAPGVQATAVCAISGGIITSFNITNPGAGYTSAPAVIIFPQQSDLNYFPQAGVTPPATKNATAFALTSFVGQVTAVLSTDEGSNPLSAAPALTFSGGGGSGAAATVVMPTTIVGINISAGSSGFGATGTAVPIISAGGNVSALTSGLGVAANSPIVSTQLIVTRQAQIVATSSGGVLSALTGQAQTAVSGILDGGVFTSIPVLYAIGNQGSAQPTIAVTMGSVNDVVYVTPV